ncbi:MAG: NADP-dependent oxidoreductase [Proteobacteria bacterium]|nr:NADP-dependent oxidoreductase [Pseudomonadota bacterium]
MKAIYFSRYSGPEVLEYGEFPEPELAPDQVLIEVHAVSVAPSDWLVRAGHLQHMFPQRFPAIPGRDGSGVVIAAGPDADFAQVGDAVVFKVGHVELGSYAERIARPREMVVAKPANVSHIEAAAGGHAGTCAWIGLVREAQVRPGMKVLIHGGAGAIGGLSLQLAKHLGAAPVITTCRRANVDYVLSIGADLAIAYDEADFREQFHDCDVVFDLVGGAVHDRSYEVLKPGGVLTWLIAEPFESRAGEFDVIERQAVIDDDPAALRGVIDLMDRGAMKPQIVKVMPLEAAAAAQALLEAGKVSRGRIVLQVKWDKKYTALP